MIKNFHFFKISTTASHYFQIKCVLFRCSLTLPFYVLSIKGTINKEDKIIMAYQHILVPVDGSEISFSAVKHAIELAKAFNCKITAISVIAEDPFSGADFYYTTGMLEEYFKEAYNNAQQALGKVIEMAKVQGINIETSIIKGSVSAETIIHTAEELKVDLIVMGSHGRKGFQKWLLGSFAQDVLSQTQLPVFIVKQ